MNPPPVSQRRVLALALLALVGCQGKSEPDPPRPPQSVIEARTTNSTRARIVAGHPCRAEVEGDELLVGTMPLVAQVGNTRWSGEPAEAGTTVRKDGELLFRIADIQEGVDVFDPQGAAVLHISADGALANAKGEILRRAEPARAAVQIGETTVTGTSDLALAVLVTAPELIPEVRALAACHRLFAREQATRK